MNYEHENFIDNINNKIFTKFKLITKEIVYYVISYILNNFCNIIINYFINISK